MVSMAARAARAASAAVAEPAALAALVWTTATMVLVEMAVTVDLPGTAQTVGKVSMP
jgi:hypothetical protein